MQGMITMTEQEYQRAIEEAAEKAIQAQRINKNTFQRVMDEFEDDLKKFNWIEHWSYINNDGNLIERVFNRVEESKVRNAIGTLIKAVFRVKRTSHIPSDKANKAMRLTSEIINILIKEITA